MQRVGLRQLSRNKQAKSQCSIISLSASERLIFKILVLWLSEIETNILVWDGNWNRKKWNNGKLILCQLWRVFLQSLEVEIFETFDPKS